MTTRMIAIKALKPGDMLDLAGDKFADPDHDNPYLECQYAVVAGIEFETPNCIRVDFEEGSSVGFPPEHFVRSGN